MQFSISISQSTKWVILILTILSPLSLSDPRATIADHFCEDSDLTVHKSFFTNYDSVMGNLSLYIDKKRWGFYSIESPKPQIFGLAQCHKDLSYEDCVLCFDQARKTLTRCLPAIKGRIYLDGCFIRYDNYRFYEEIVEPNYDSVPCGTPTGFLKETYLHLGFASKVNQVVANVTATAASDDESGGRRGFGVGEVKSGVNGVYALGQCWNSLDVRMCRACLDDAGEKIRQCLPAGEGRALNAGCYLRYSTKRFFSVGSKKIDVVHEGISATWVFVIAIIAVAFIVLSLLGAYIGYDKYSKKKEECQKLARMPSALHKSGLNFKYEMLEQATDSFSTANKLGQGGCGSVFKGTLPDGRTVAVKRLFFNTRQWADDFFNEVNLISGIQHKNLVRLLGCSIEGPESLLVYEFVPNKSLDQILFDRKNMQNLNWQQKFDIVLGIAEGLAYLHGGSKARIIHRDIKSGNILLEDDLTPKIADFGLARCVSADKSHISTGIAGTLGYMAPEYMVRGQLTEKADVYAFGVLALEIACGRKNNIFMNSGSVLHNVWNHYKSGRITESVQTGLINELTEKEVSNVLQVGLLCIQASASSRPFMSEVVAMLNNKETPIPSPKQPPFLNSSVLAANSTTKASIMSSSSSNWHATIDMLPTDHRAESFSATSPQSDGPSAIEIRDPR